VQGSLQVTGVVSATNFNRYELQIAPSNGSAGFSTIAGPFTQQAPTNNSILATVNMATIPNGEYIMRLAVFATDGGYVNVDARIVVNNPLPTPTPTVPPIPTTPPQSVFTPLPFDPLATQPFGGQSAPTPSATINPGG
jgi:hypothetical protein